MPDAFYSRLTWNPICPYPFESAWMVFAKLLAINVCKPRQIVKIIKRSEIAEDYPLDYRSSTWIDFEKFGAALEIDHFRLRLCFLDQIGFVVPAYDRHGGVRHCPVCLKSGFHHVFFELGIVNECPVHHVPLLAPCPQCARGVLRDGFASRSRKDPTNLGLSMFESKCGHVSFDGHNYDADAWLIPRELQRENKAISSQFIAWSARVANLKPSLKVLSEGLSAGTVLERELDDLSNRLRLIERLAGVCPIATLLGPCDRVYASWEVRPASEAIETDRAMQMYGAVRRHLFNRYIRPHRRCWAIVKRLNRRECWVLNRDAICSVAIAFAAWRMAISGYVNVEVLSRKPRVPCRRFRYPDRMHGDDSDRDLKGLGVWMIATFLSIWERVLEHSKSGDFYVEALASEGDFPQAGNITWSSLLCDSGVYRSVIFPDPLPLEATARQSCDAVHRLRTGVINDPEAESADSWAWTGRDSFYANQNTLFRFKSATGSKLSPRSFQYVMV